jgi:hypothetical protein
MPLNFRYYRRLRHPVYLPSFCHKYKLTIKDDTKGFTEDTHPGYLGYKQFSEVAIKFLETRLY